MHVRHALFACKKRSILLLLYKLVTSKTEGAILLVVDGGRGVVEVHRPQRGRVDGVLRVVHPQAVRHLSK